MADGRTWRWLVFLRVREERKPPRLEPVQRRLQWRQ